MIDLGRLTEAVGELEEDEVYEILRQVMDEGGSQANDAMEACQRGMDLVGEKFESGEYFVGDLIFAGEIMQGAVDILKDAIITGDGSSAGRVLLCTVKDDLHDIGKNIVKAILSASGFEVIDLGIDTPPEKIVETVKAENLKIVLLSGVLTLAVDSMKTAVDQLREAGLDDVKVMIGGAPVNEEACRRTGADAWARNPQDTVRICKTWIA